MAYTEEAVADPGFAQRGGAKLAWGRQHKILPKSGQKNMEFKEFGPPGGTSIPANPRPPWTHH